MPDIKITDALAATVATAQPKAASAFTKYLTGTPAGLFAAADAVAQLRKPLAAAGGQKITFGLTFSGSFALGSTEAELTIESGAQAFVTVQTGKALFADDLMGDPIQVPAGQAYVSFGFTPRIALGLSQPLGDLTFGFEVGSSFETRCYRMLPLNAGLSVADATVAVLNDFTLPGDLADLKSLAVGDVNTVTGKGTLRVNASFDLATVVNPLASPALPLGIGAVKLKAGASVEVSAGIEVRGEYQIRVQKLSATKVRLGCYRLTGRAWDVAVDASFGASVTLGKRDLLALFLKKFMRSEADVKQLVEAGLTDEQVDRILETAEQSMSRTFAVSLQAELSGVKEHEAAFLYDIDLVRLQAAPAGVRAAVHHALDGDFSGLAALEKAPPSSGLTLVRSAIRTFRERKTAWRINLLGLYNIISVSTLLMDGEVLWEPQSGALVVTEKASAERIRIKARPGEADGEKLREVVFESLMLTATYRAALLCTEMDLEAAQTYFEFHSSTSQATMLDHLDAVVALELMTDPERAAALPVESQFGASTLLLTTTFNQKACEAMFLANGKPRKAGDYEALGRKVMAALLRPGEDQQRRTPMVNDTLWKNMTDTGGSGSAFDAVIKAANPVLVPRVGILRSDMLMILWWAEAMAQAAVRLLEMRQFLKGKDPETVKDDHDFKKLKEKLERAMAESLAKNKVQFGDPWGLLALASAAGKNVEKQAIVASPKYSLVRPA